MTAMTQNTVSLSAFKCKTSHTFLVVDTRRKQLYSGVRIWKFVAHSDVIKSICWRQIIWYRFCELMPEHLYRLSEVMPRRWNNIFDLLQFCTRWHLAAMSKFFFMLVKILIKTTRPPDHVRSEITHKMCTWFKVKVIAWPWNSSTTVNSEAGENHFQKYHNTLCLFSKILRKHCFYFLLRLF